MHVVSKKDLNSAELETMRISRNPTTVMTANGEVQTREEATIYVKQLDLFVKVMFLEKSPAVLSLGKLCEDHGYTYHWTSGQKPHLTRNDKRIDCNVSSCVPFICVSWFISEFFLHHTVTYFFIIFITGCRYLITETLKVQSQKEVEARVKSLVNPLHESTGKENKKKMRNAKKYRAIYHMNCQIGYRNSERIWSMKVVR